MRTAQALAFAAVVLLAPLSASAQSIQIGPGGPSVDLRSERERERDFRREEARRERELERRQIDREERRAERRAMEREAERRGPGRGCREITIRERDEYGRFVTRTREECR